MKHDEILTSLQHSAAVKLLQGQNAPLVLSFLYRQFKQKQRATIPHPQLSEKLESYLAALAESHPERYTGTADYYLRTWCDDDHRFLRKYYDSDSDDPVYELTPDTEQAIGWVEELQKGEFVGTESRFLRIFDLLQEIVTHSTEDAAARLERLEQEKAAIQAQIDHIKETGEIERFSQTQIKERFFEANDVARRLLADFREVEENFRAIARQVQAQQLQAGMQKGRIVANILDADQALKESDQGRSFYTFWEFLMSPQKQAELQELLTAVYQLPDADQTDPANQRLRRIKRNLIDAGAKVVASNRRLGEQVRKLLDEQQLAEARRVMELAAEIKQTAVSLSDHPPRRKKFFRLETTPDVNLPLERPLWSPNKATTLSGDTPAVADVDLTAVDLDTLYSQFYVDDRRLRRCIAALLDEHPQVTLAHLLAHYPLQKGLAELVTYVAIAAHDDAHQIVDGQTEMVDLNGNGRRARLPQVIFRRDSHIQPHDQTTNRADDQI